MERLPRNDIGHLKLQPFMVHRPLPEQDTRPPPRKMALENKQLLVRLSTAVFRTVQMLARKETPHPKEQLEAKLVKHLAPNTSLPPPLKETGALKEQLLLKVSVDPLLTLQVDDEEKETALEND